MKTTEVLKKRTFHFTNKSTISKGETEKSNEETYEKPIFEKHILRSNKIIAPTN